MKRIALVIAGFAALAGVPFSRYSLTNGVVGTYTELSMACMRASDAVRAHTEVVTPAAAAGVALLALLAVASAVAQLRRTSTTVKSLVGGSVAPPPPRLKRLTATLGLHGRVDLVTSDGMLALCYGIRRPRLMLSTALLDAMADDELEAVVRHEAAHLRRWDPLRILTARSLSRAFAFIPLSPVMLQAYLCRRELEADRESVKAMGDVIPLAAALQRMLASAQHPPLADLAVGALSATDVRIDQLLGNEVSSRSLFANINRLHAFVFTLAVTATACVLISTAHAATGVRPCIPC